MNNVIRFPDSRRYDCTNDLTAVQPCHRNACRFCDMIRRENETSAQRIKLLLAETRGVRG
jgi:hypothetical protein